MQFSTLFLQQNRRKPENGRSYHVAKDVFFKKTARRHEKTDIFMKKEL
jgi:hypothetical protein